MVQSTKCFELKEQSNKTTNSPRIEFIPTTTTIATNTNSSTFTVSNNLEKRRVSFFQLTGHKESFKRGTRPDTILKKATGNERECLNDLMRDKLSPFVPKIYGIVEQEDGVCYLEMQDLLANFGTASVMDIKMGYRTYGEEELYSALRESKLRPDMFDKMVEIDQTEPTQEERRLSAVTKPRYMIWRETVSSSASLGFRIEAMRLRDGTIDKDFKTMKEEECIGRALLRFAKSHEISMKYLRRLYDLRQALMQSHFFSTHEMIGSSLLFVHDDCDANIWLIDFAKTHSLPENNSVTHKGKWELGNHEDGYLDGMDNLIRVFESTTIDASSTDNRITSCTRPVKMCVHSN